MSFIRHSTFSGASGMELSTFFSCKQEVQVSDKLISCIVLGSVLSYFLQLQE